MTGPLLDPFVDNPFLVRSLLAGVLVALACAVAGTFVVLRGLAFVADALAHGVLPGIAIAVLIGAPTVLGAAAGTVVMMGGVSVITRRSRLSSDTAIGLLFAGMLALGVMITSRSQTFFGDLTRIFTGEILGVSDTDLWWQLGALGAVCATAWTCRRPFLLLSLDPDLAATSGFAVRRYENLLLFVVAVAILSSFQTVGTLLVFGMLVAPASTAALVSRRVGVMMLIAAVIGALSVYVGLLLSYHADLAAGASVVVVSVGLFLVTLAITEVRRSAEVRRERAASPAHVHEHGGGHGHQH